MVEVRVKVRVVARVSFGITVRVKCQKFGLFDQLFIIWSIIHGLGQKFANCPCAISKLRSSTFCKLHKVTNLRAT